MTQILTRDQLRQMAPAAFATAPADNVSDRYKFISTLDILDAMEAEGFMPVTARQSNRHQKDNLGAHEITFRTADQISAPRLVGDSLPEIRLVNSHNRAATYSLTAGLFRLVCSNGLTIADSSSKMMVKGRHSGEDSIRNIIEGTYRIIEEFPVIADQINAFRAIDLDNEQALEFAKGATLLRWNEPNAEVSTMLLKPRREADAKTDLWSVMNVVQENLIRGGQEYMSNTGRRLHSAAISTLELDQRINSDLWKLTETAAEVFA